MTQIPAFSPLDPLVNTQGPENRFDELTSEDFIRIIFAELTNQDPFEPNDSSALLDQLNSIRSIESDIQVTETIQSLVRENQLATASGMIGKFVGARTEDFDRVAGYVVSVVKQGDSVQLELDQGVFVPFENVETVIDPSLFNDDAPTDPAGLPSGPADVPPDPAPATDLNSLLEGWENGDLAVDVNGDGIVNINDLLDLLQDQQNTP